MGLGLLVFAIKNNVVYLTSVPITPPGKTYAVVLYYFGVIFKLSLLTMKADPGECGKCPGAVVYCWQLIISIQRVIGKDGKYPEI